MASRTIGTILSLRDNMSGRLVRVSSRINSMSREAQRASRQVANMANNFKKKADEMANKAIKFAGVGASIAGAFALKTGLSEAMDLEGFRVQLETATKDAKKAGEIMKWAVDLANKTPFEAAPLVEGASKLEMMGINAQKYLPLIGDMAAATNKPVDQAVEAMIDAQTGELERLKEFGITKAQIAKKAGEMFRNQEVINNKGQIVDQKKFNDALVAIMTERYKGGMDKLSNTTKGLWSTVTGVTKSALANIVGITADGTIKQGSLLDKLKERVKQIASTLEKWQQDGTIQKVSQAFSDGFTKIYNIVSKVASFILEHRKTFETLVVTIAGFMIAVKVANAIKTAIMGVQIVWALFNGTLALTPLGWVVIGITAVISAGYALWRNWDAVKAKAFELWEGLKAAFSPVAGFFASIWGSVSSSFSSAKNFIINGLNSIISKINSLASFKLPSWIPWIGGKQVGVKIPKIGANALGTSYWRGGLTSINEHGGEIINLPSGSQVIPADKSKNMLNSKSDIIVNVNVQGNIIGNEEYANYIGNTVVRKVRLALDTM